MNLRNLVRADTKVLARKLRRNPTRAERLLWQQLRREQLGAKFRRQAVIRGWVADFWCPSARIVIEVDGGYHDTPRQRSRDMRRDVALMKLGIKTLRFTNEDVFERLGTVVSMVRGFLRVAA